MSLIGRNIKKLRGVKKLSQTAFADLFKLSRTSVGAYEEERADPKIDTIVMIAKYFGITIDNLLTKEMTINEILHFDKFGEPFLGKPKKRKDAQVLTSSVSVPIVDLADVISYRKNREDKEYLGLLDQFHYSSFDFENKTVFKLDKDFKSYGLEKGALLVASQSEQEGTKLLLSEDGYYILEDVSDEEGEVWAVLDVISFSKPKPNQITDRVKLLESKMDEMMRKLEN